MTDDDPSDGMDWLRAELEDALDEDYELEISEPELSLELRKIFSKRHPDAMPRADYFEALLNLQSELIKLQDWVVHTGQKIRVPPPCDLLRLPLVSNPYHHRVGPSVRIER